jgi:secretion/DNA translocation related TadE-like protein
MARSEHGSVSVVVVAMTAVALLLTLGSVDIGAALLARSRARGAADAAALAAVQELAFPTGRSPAEIADRYARSNGAELLSCQCARGTFEAIVEVRVPTSRPWIAFGTRWVNARARAVVDLPTLGPARDMPHPP